MGWFDKDPIQEQLEIYGELLEEKQAELDGLDGVSGSASVEAHREQLQEQIKHIQLNIEQTQESAARAGRDAGSIEPDTDFFED